MAPSGHKAAVILDGKAMAAGLQADIAREVKAMSAAPGLAVILVGDDPASHVYVGHKIKACKNAGIRSIESRMPASASYEDVRGEIERLNEDPSIHGILLQLPLPAHLDSDDLIQRIDPAKDVDGLTFANIGRLTAGAPGLIPCTPQGALALIEATGKDLSGLHAVVIGRSLLFGKPMGQLLLTKNCTVTQAHSKSKNLPEICRGADILVAAVGRPKMVGKDWIKSGAIVIDVGINRMPDGTLCGDVDYESAKEIAGFITPVPGGVGPMTIVFLLKNTIQAAKSL